MIQSRLMILQLGVAFIELDTKADATTPPTNEIRRVLILVLIGKQLPRGCQQIVNQCTCDQRGLGCSCRTAVCPEVATGFFDNVTGEFVEGVGGPLIGVSLHDQAHASRQGQRTASSLLFMMAPWSTRKVSFTLQKQQGQPALSLYAATINEIQFFVFSGCSQSSVVQALLVQRHQEQLVTGCAESCAWVNNMAPQTSTESASANSLLLLCQVTSILWDHQVDAFAAYFASASILEVRDGNCSVHST
eukprot:109821-Amphidinium_carterae.1